MARKSPGRPRSAAPKPRLPIIVSIRAPEAWRAWIDGECTAMAGRIGMARVDRTQVIDAALREWAERNGRPRPPERS